MSESDRKSSSNGTAGDGAAPSPGEGPEADGGPRAAAAEAPAAPAAVEETSASRAERVEREKAETHDRLLRVAADFENYKKRARREMEEAANRGREALLKELLPVLDNLERALTAVSAGGGVEALGEGVRLVEKQFHAALEKFQVRRFDAHGEPFDPARHEAIQQIETDVHPPGAVAQVFARGYTIGERLLRPAMVAVAKAKSVVAAAVGAAAVGEPAPPPDPAKGGTPGSDDVVH